MGHSHNITKALIIALLLAIIVIALHIVSLATPWWVSSSLQENNNTCVVDNVMGWSQATIACHNCDSISCATNYLASEEYWNGNWRQNCKQSKYPTLCQRFPQIFDAVLSMVSIGLILTFFLLLDLLILVMIPKFVPGFFKSKFLHTALALLGFLCGLVAVIVMATAIPAAYNAQFGQNNCPSEGCSFFGSKQYNGTTLYWGPTTGWIVEAVNLLFEFLLLILCMAANAPTTKPPV